MSKVLYIKANIKNEGESRTFKVADSFVEEYKKNNPEDEIITLDLYKENIDFLRADDLGKLFGPKDEESKNNSILKYAYQFADADKYIIAAPMWSLSFPAPLKEYIDCIMQDQKTIKFEGKKIEPLLNDKPRTMVYIQSSGGNVPWMLRPILNKGLNYVEDIIKFMGIKKFEELLVDDTGFTEEEKQEAINKAYEKIDDIIDSMKF